IKINYHDACHLRNASIPIIEEPRTILNSIDNIELVEMNFNKTKSICCGAGGGVYSAFKENSDYNAKSIFDNMNKGKALITACPFCFTALNRIREENNIKKPVIKFEDFIGHETQGLRAIPINKSINDTRQIMPYEDILKVIDNFKYYSVSSCPCSHRHNLDDNFDDCKHNLERCLHFDDLGRYCVENGLGREITKRANSA
ncbi:unnamed protein product, partial [marine sediment metagenome]